ncbi:MAG TPA: tripartite tricarboxylate transporter substrate binding protein [Xanthobacteraceae bacterium]|jgi:tripartite-type tricarboxylate transporter receptor subunit TctC|nr:tripartite tricarboxylate transporter substrate binding protein [Xanthobacteraceae bacterium]
MVRHCIALAALGVVLTTPAGPAGAEEWPAHPVRIVNTFAPGGAADVLARIVAERLTRAFGQQFFVETRVGAGGLVGVQSIADTDPDGYNFVITTLSLNVIAPIINPKAGSVVRELTNIAYIAGSPIVLVVNPNMDVDNLSDFITYAKRNARPLTYSSSGVGSNGQLVAELFAHKAGIRIEHVPYKGASQGLMDLLGGHIAFSSQTLSSASGAIRARSLVPLAHTGSARIPDYPDVPTFKELGYPELVTTNWFALAGPAGLPKEIVGQINREIVAAMAEPEVQERLRQDGLTTEPMDAETFNKFVESEVAKWRPVVNWLGLSDQ